MKTGIKAVLLLGALSLSALSAGADLGSLNYHDSKSDHKLEKYIGELLVVADRASNAEFENLLQQFDHDEMKRKLHEANRAQVESSIKKYAPVAGNALTAIN